MSHTLNHAVRDDWSVRRKKSKGELVRRIAREIAKAVFEHRLSENTLGSTNVKGKL